MTERTGLVCVGSMCRRPVHGADGLSAVVDRLEQILPRRTRLHLFGVKGDAIPYLTAFAHRVASIDSQAYGVSARNAARRCGQPKTDRMVADHMALWLCRQHARLDRPSRRLPMHPEMPPQPEPADPWERAIAQARREIRDLLEPRHLHPDAMTAPSAQHWAAAHLPQTTPDP